MKNKVTWLIGLIVFVIGCIAFLYTSIGYPIYAFCHYPYPKLRISWFLILLLKWFIYTEGCGVIMLFGVLVAKIGNSYK